MPHVELSLTEDVNRLTPVGSGRAPLPATPVDPTGASLARWSVAAGDANEPCLVLAADAVIVAASVSCARLLGLGDPAIARGRRLREALDNLVDFTASPAQLDHAEADKIPPLLAISSGRLARGLMRTVCATSGDAITLDAIATPLWDGPTLVGSLSFFSKV